MLRKLRRSLVESFVGAIALGWLFAQAILHFAYIFAAPFANWLMRREYRGVLDRNGYPVGFSFADALPEVIRCVVLLVVGYLLLRWLYFKPLDDEPLKQQIPTDPSVNS